MKKIYFETKPVLRIPSTSIPLEITVLPTINGYYESTIMVNTYAYRLRILNWLCMRSLV